MYTIYCDDYLLHSEVDDYQLANVKLVLEVNTAGSLEFTVLESHPSFSALQKLKPTIKVLKNGVVYWKGRIVEDTQNLDLTHDIYCEGKMRALDDTIVRPASYNDSAGDVAITILAAHNAQVEDFQVITSGTMWATTTFEKEVVEYKSTYAFLQDLIALYGGYLVMRYEEYGDYLDWVSDFTTVSTQAINLGENILNLTQETTASEIYTACIPLGYVDPVTKQRIKLSNTPGEDVMINTDLVDDYGLIFAPISETTWDDAKTVGALSDKAFGYLTLKSGVLTSLVITALDLAYTDADIDSFNICEYINVSSSVHNILAQYLLSRAEIDISNPANDRITLGATIATFTDSSGSSTNNITSSVNIIQNTINNIGGGMDYTIASQAEAEAGTNDSNLMTPLKTKYAIDALGEHLPTPKSGTGTITTTGWVSNTGDYPQKLDLAITGIEASDVIMVSVNLDNMDIATACQLCPTIDSYAGGLTFYAKEEPTESIGFSYYSVITTSQEGGDFTKGISFVVDGSLTLATGLCGQHSPLAMTVKKIYMSCGTAPTGADMIIDINKNGTTMYTSQANRPKITAGNTTTTVWLPDVLSIAEGDLITFDIDQIGSTVPGGYLRMMVVCEV